MNEAEALDYICTELSNLTSCITNRLDTCDDATVKDDVIMAKDIVEYLCSAEGRPVERRVGFLCIASPQGDLRLSGPPSGQGAGSGARMERRNGIENGTYLDLV
ncbi:hypothetical protein PoB_003611500 [Plakobranchus ocellatus]|uniref:Uncharacterized protein n=1 Tax=Plakobranchus ocellatus TaxID=259542 RepID=A0AAV4AN16_9GAST|nr:hypothetical protein PoB_003611500 [Plakobranchus ocellatus]